MGTQTVYSRSPRIMHFLSINALLLLPILVHPSKASAPPVREAYVTLLYGNFYVLPVRVMMQSLLKNSPDVASGHRERIVIVTGSTSSESIDQMRRENRILNGTTSMLIGFGVGLSWAGCVWKA